MNLQRYLRRRTAAILLLFSVSVILGQNCGRGFVTDPKAGMDDLASLDVSQPFSSPQVDVLSPPPADSNSKSINLQIVSTADLRTKIKTISCQLDANLAQDCTGGTFNLTNLSEGDHTVRIDAEDMRGQKAQQKVLQFRIDTIAPVLAVSQAPANVTGSNSVSVVFTATDSTSGIRFIQCSLDGAAFANCTSPFSAANLGEGSHSLKIQAYDKANNLSQTTMIAWTVNSEAPTVNLANKPNAVTNTTTASFVFSGSAGGTALVSYECSLDNGAYSSCTSPKTYNSLTNGSHSFNVRGTSAANIVSSPVAYNWLVDTVAPSGPTVSASVSTLTKSTTANMVFSSTDSGSMIKEYQCSLNNATFAVCSSPQALSGLASGEHGFRAKAIDNAGNESSLGVFNWTIDSVVPTLTFTSTPASNTMETSASFVFGATDSGSGIDKIECSLDSAVYAVCTSPQNFSNLATGTHGFTVRVTDKAGNETVKNHAWVIASSGPIDGVALYNNNCMVCHGALASSTKKDKTADQITNALATIPQMNFMNTKFNATEIAAIASALKSSSTPGPSTPIGACTPETIRGGAKEAVRRLSSNELKASVRNLFPNIAYEIEKAFEAYPEYHLVEEFEKYSQIHSQSQVSQWAMIVDSIFTTLVSANRIGDIDTCLKQSSIAESCWRGVFTTFGKKVYRRPLDTGEVNKLTSLAMGISNTQDAIYAALHMLLRSPAFLFHFEIGVSDDGKRIRLSDYEVANRISFAILGTPPDATLLAAADSGSLKTTTQVRAQAQRLVDTAEAQTKLKTFFEEWLELGRVKNPDTIYTDWYLDYGQSGDWDKMMRQEIHDYLFYIFWKKKGTFTELMTAEIAFPKFQGRKEDIQGDRQIKAYSALAGIYGGTPYSGFTPEGQPAQPFPAPNNPGLLTRAGLLSTARWTTEIITRGVFVQKRILCENLPSPDFSIVNQRLSDVGSLDPLKMANHEIITAKTGGSTCIGCHGRINPTGFALEMYDMVGKLRPREKVLDTSVFYDPVKKGVAVTHPLPSVANVPMGDKTVAISSPAQLAREIASSDRAKSCLSTFVLRHFDRRIESGNDSCAISEVTKVLNEDQPVINVFIESLANEDIFWRRK